MDDVLPAEHPAFVPPQGLEAEPGLSDQFAAQTAYIWLGLLLLSYAVSQLRALWSSFAARSRSPGRGRKAPHLSPPPLARLGEAHNSTPAGWGWPGRSAASTPYPTGQPQSDSPGATQFGSPYSQPSPWRGEASSRGSSLRAGAILAWFSRALGAVRGSLASIARRTRASRGMNAVTVNPAPAINTAAVSSGGWDPALLAQCQAHEASISSVQGLQNSTEFQTYIRERHGNLDRHMAQVTTCMDTYTALRAIDRPSFLHALTRRDVKVFESGPVPRLLALTEITLSTVLTCAMYLGWVTTDAAYGTGLAAWLVAQVLLAWACGHPSLVGRLTGVYCVRECALYPDHEPVAPLWRVVCAGLLDAVFAAVTLGGSALVSALLVLATARRQTAGQLIAGVHCVKERACGNAVVPRFQSPSGKSSRRRGLNSNDMTTHTGDTTTASLSGTEDIAGATPHTTDAGLHTRGLRGLAGTATGTGGFAARLARGISATTTPATGTRTGGASVRRNRLFSLTSPAPHDNNNNNTHDADAAAMGQLGGAAAAEGGEGGEQLLDGGAAANPGIMGIDLPWFFGSTKKAQTPGTGLAGGPSGLGGVGGQVSPLPFMTASPVLNPGGTTSRQATPLTTQDPNAQPRTPWTFGSKPPTTGARGLRTGGAGPSGYPGSPLPAYIQSPAPAAAATAAAPAAQSPGYLHLAVAAASRVPLPELLDDTEEDLAQAFRMQTEVVSASPLSRRLRR